VLWIIKGNLIKNCPKVAKASSGSLLLFLASHKGVVIQDVTIGYPELSHAVMPPSILYTCKKPAFTRIVLA